MFNKSKCEYMAINQANRPGTAEFELPEWPEGLRAAQMAVSVSKSMYSAAFLASDAAPLANLHSPRLRYNSPSCLRHSIRCDMCRGWCLRIWLALSSSLLLALQLLQSSDRHVGTTPRDKEAAIYTDEVHLLRL